MKTRRYRLRVLVATAALVGAVVVWWLSSVSPSQPGSEKRASVVATDVSRGSFGHSLSRLFWRQPPPDPVAESLLSIFYSLEDKVMAGLESVDEPESPEEVEPLATTVLPDLPIRETPDAGLREAVAWFESLKKEPEIPQKQYDSMKRQMAKSGLELHIKECRQGICRSSFTYTNWHPRRPARAAARAYPLSWIFTTIDPDGKPRDDIFTQMTQ